MNGRVLEWHKRFSERRKHVYDDSRYGCRKTVKTYEHVEKVRKTVHTDLGMAVITAELWRDTDTHHQILTISLDMKKVCVHMVPHCCISGAKTDHSDRTSSLLSRVGFVSLLSISG